MGRHTITAPSDRDRAIIELRAQRLTYQEVGDQVGLTRQRIEQIVKRWRPDLTGRGVAPRKPSFAVRIEKHCEYCDTEFGLRLLPYAAKRQRYCSRSCAGLANHGSKYRGKKYTVSDLALTVLEMRRNGMTWKAVGEKLGISPITAIRSCLAHEHATGADMSAAFPRRR